ncbi:hypothetical protein H920_10803 [Fukomys damarensis]|uniref:Uncharacterized protein n=1 Tax=Fukomys damarensis TaxID=885580 RepID=A0A091DBE1_FUKDA|nr:hypothetical protein H920_10803 [Fukomys damarensis]
MPSAAKQASVVIWLCQKNTIGGKTKQKQKKTTARLDLRFGSGWVQPWGGDVESSYDTNGRGHFGSAK